MNDLKEMVNTNLGLIFKVGVILVILSTLFLFTNLTTEFYDTAKFLVLLVFTAIILILLTLKFTLTGKVTILRTPLDLPLLLLLAVAVVATILSPSLYGALVGNQLRIHGSLISLIVYILFYFILVNSLKSQKEIRWILVFSTVAAQILSVVTLLSYAGVKILPAPWTHGPNFTPTGSSFSTSAILALLIPFVVMQILTASKPLFITANSLFLTIMGVTIALTGTWASWIASLLGVALAFLVSDLSDLSNLSNLRNLSQIRPARLFSLAGLIIPVAVVVLVLALSFIPPIGGAKNPLYEQAKNFPREIQLGFIPSWKISVSAFRDSPFWGTGPSSYLFNFTSYKPIEFNSTKFWNLRFDGAFNEYLGVLGTLGGIGLLALVSLTALFAQAAYRVLWSHLRGVHQLSPQSHLGGELKTALAISGLVFFIILALHSSTLPVWIFGLIILSSFWVTDISESVQKNWRNVLTLTSSEETVRIDALPSVLLTVSLALSLFALFFGGKYLLADYHHRLALNAVAANNGVLAYNELVAAEKLNPQSDLYRTDIAQVNFALANAIASAKGPTEASPAGSLTDQDKQNIQVLLQQSINEARTAVQFSPRSVINWEILALLYRQISGVAQNALIFSLDAYGRAIFQDPLNPLLRLNVGGTYYAVQNYDLAIRFFTDSINLKPDFANGYYNLSVALRDKGDLNSALVAAQKVVDLVEPKNDSNPDFKVATDYLSDLKSKVSPPTPEQPPAAATSGELQNEKLPKVLDVGQPPEKIATPEAIKKPSPTPSPRP